MLISRWCEYILWINLIHSTKSTVQVYYCIHDLIINCPLKGLFIINCYIRLLNFTFNIIIMYSSNGFIMHPILCYNNDHIYYIMSKWFVINWRWPNQIPTATDTKSPPGCIQISVITTKFRYKWIHKWYYICVCMYVCMYVCSYVCVCMCIRVYWWIHN